MVDFGTENIREFFLDALKEGGRTSHLFPRTIPKGGVGKKRTEHLVKF